MTAQTRIDGTPAPAGTVGAVGSLWRFPVKSMGGEELAESAVTEAGFVGDRAFALVDPSDGKVASAKNPRKWGRLLGFRAAYATPPATGGGPLPTVRMELPDGQVATSDDPGLDEVLTAAVGRPVAFAASAAPGTVLEEYWPDVENLAPREFIQGGMIPTDDPAETVSDFPIATGAPAGTFFDLSAVHVLATATLERLRELNPDGDYDLRRYRANVVVRSEPGQAGFAENDWVGRLLHLGDEVTLRVTMPCPRCVMTTLAQGDLPRDLASLRTVAKHNLAPVAGFGTFACAGAYADVVRPGVVRAGDAVTLE